MRKLRSTNKTTSIVIPVAMVFEILSYIHPLLHCLIAGEYFHSITSLNASNKLLPLSLLTLSLNNREFLEDFRAVLLSYKFRTNMATQLAMHGDYFSMLWFQDHDFTLPESAIVIVSKRGDLKLFERLISEFPGSLKKFFVEKSELMIKSLSAAAEYGHINILEYLLPNMLYFQVDGESIIPQITTIFKRAAGNGHLEFLKRFLQMFFHQLDQANLTRIKNEMVFSAIKWGHMQILLWISESLGWIPQAEVVWDRERHFGTEGMFVAMAARTGNLEMVEFLIDKGFEFRHKIVTQESAGSGNLGVLMYLRSLDCPWSVEVYIAAAKEGHLDILQWAKSNECPWDSSLLFPAAASSNDSNVDVFQWLLDQQCPFTEEVSYFAACNEGNFEFIKFAKSNGSAIYQDDMQDFFAEHGNLEAILWAINQTNPPTIRSMPILRMAAKEGHIHILEWLETVESTERLAGMIETLASGHTLRSAAMYGHVGVLKWAVNHGYQWDAERDYKYYIKAIEYGQLEALNWMNEKAPIFTTDIGYPSICAAQEGYLEIVKWLHNHGCPCSLDTREAADFNHHSDVSKWVQQQLFGRSRNKKYYRLDMWERD
jgi:ankyrin repeat protein